MQTFLVGGAVRDELLGIPVVERDWVVVGGTPQQLIDQGFRPVGKDFPVFLHPESKEEYALARTERKTGAGYYGFETRFSPDVTLEQDLERRDLTINAIARDEDSGELFDPFNGQRDLNARILRHVSAAFTEDPLRVLRLARFAARFAHLGFEIAPETLELLRAMTASGELNSLVAERVWQETARALSERTPQRYFEVLRQIGALAVIFPEVDALYGVPQPAKWHPEIDTGIHTLLVLEQAAKLDPSTQVRFAALTHDLGKGETPREHWPSHSGHEERSVKLLDGLCKRLRVPNDHRELALLVARHHGVVHRAFELRDTTLVKLLENTDAYRRSPRFNQFLLACEADARGRTGLENDPYPQADLLRSALEATRGITPTAEDISRLQGPAIAERLHQRRCEVVHALRTSRVDAK
jgi:tRNA nucleotidyltransferase (CCA-adding enzyme)